MAPWPNACSHNEAHSLFSGPTKTLVLEHSTKNWGVMLTLCCQVLKADAIKRRFELLAEQGNAWFMGKRLLPGP